MKCQNNRDSSPRTIPTFIGQLGRYKPSCPFTIEPHGREFITLGLLWSWFHSKDYYIIPNESFIYLSFFAMSNHERVNDEIGLKRRLFK